MAKGQPTASLRYVDGEAYITSVTGYDDVYRSTGAAVMIPEREGALAGTYASSATFNVDGSAATTTMPAVGMVNGAGGLPAETITYGYNAVGLPTTVSGASTYVTETAYDSLGRVGTQKLADGNGKTLTQVWAYEQGTGRLLEHGVLNSAGSVVYKDANYTYDNAGNIRSIKDKTAQYPGGAPDDNQCFTLDYLQRITEAWTPTSGNCDTAPTTAGLGGPAPYWQSFTYDLTGNRKTQVDHAAAGNTTRTSSYPAAGGSQPHTVSQVVTSDAATGTDTYTYDLAGNTITRNRAGKPGQTLTWDAEGRVATVTDTSGTSSYVYDANGSRIIAKDPSGSTLYLGGQEVRLSGGQATATRFYGGNAIRTSTNGLSWTASDIHGTNDLVFRADTLAVTQRRSKPFGEARGTTPTWPTTKGFVGGTDDPTGLTHLGAREYDPVNGRFISADPLFEGSDPQSWNGYAYAHNNPISGSDPSGLADDGQWTYQFTERLSYTSHGYKHYVRADYYFYCRSDGACLGDYDSAGNFWPNIHVEIIIISVRIPTIIGPVATPGRRTPPKAPEQCTAPKQPAKISALHCDAWEFSCLKNHPGAWWEDNKGLVENGVMVLGLAACAASAGVACAALGVAGSMISAADRVYEFGKAGDHSARAIAGLGAGLAFDAFMAKASLRGVGCLHSFDPDTPVAKADGSTEPIKDIKVGDEVLATDPATGQTTAAAVTALHRNQDTDLSDVTVTTGDGDGAGAAGASGTETLHTTQHHPFWDETSQAWVDAARLQPGHQLRAATGGTVRVVSVHTFTGTREMRDLTIASIRTYYP